MAKLLTYKNSLLPEKEGGVLPSRRKQAQAFINIFCEHLLADTDYEPIQQQTIQYNSSNQYIEQMSLDVILKTITFIIWTDRSVEGYFFAKINDNTLFKLLTRLETLLHNITRH